MSSTRERGTLGEDFAAKQLTSKGYTVLERNFHSSHYEIDLIAQKEDIIAFIEVKTRSITSHVSPCESLSISQKRRIVLAAVAYLTSKGLYNTGQVQPRFDFFSIITDRPCSPNVIEFTHFEGAFGTEGLNVFV